jgi:hypothetical protein
MMLRRARCGGIQRVKLIQVFVDLLNAMCTLRSPRAAQANVDKPGEACLLARCVHPTVVLSLGITERAWDSVETTRADGLIDHMRPES